MTLVNGRPLGPTSRQKLLPWIAVFVGTVLSIGWFLLPFADDVEGASIKRVERDLQTIARAPHPTLSRELEEVRDYLIEQLKGTQASVTIQEVGSSHNILALMKGTNPSGVVMLAAHYDSASEGPGASDDGVAVAALVETARILSRERMRNDLLILLTTGEESGLSGSRAFVQEHPLAREVKVYLNFEARGTSGPPVMFETRRSSPWLLDRYRKLPRPFSSSAIVASYLTIPRDLRSRFATDIFNFERLEAAGMNFALVRGSKWYHTPGDSVDNVSWSSARHVTATAIRAARVLGDEDLSNAQERHATVWFTFLGRGVSYQHEAALVVFLVVIGMSLLLATNSRHTVGARDLTLGFVSQPVALIAAIALGGVMLMLATLVGADLLAPLADSSLGLTFSVLIAAAVALAAWRAGPARWWNPGRRFGALAWWLLIVAATSLLVPASSYLWVIPILLSGFGVLISTRAPRSGQLVRLIALAIASLLVTDLLVVAFLAGPSVAFLMASSLFLPYIWFLTQWGRRELESPLGDRTVLDASDQSRGVRTDK